MFSFTKIILIATFVVVVLSQPPKELKSLTNSVIFGEDVTGASELTNSQKVAGYQKKQSKLTLDFKYPSRFALNTNEIITKITVVVNEIDYDATFRVDILEGGVGYDHVHLQVVSENTSILGSRVNIFGVDST